MWLKINAGINGKLLILNTIIDWDETKSMYKSPYSNLYGLKNKTINPPRVSKNLFYTTIIENGTVVFESKVDK